LGLLVGLIGVLGLAATLLDGLVFSIVVLLGGLLLGDLNAEASLAWAVDLKVLLQSAKTQDCTWREITYTLPVFVGNVAVLQGKVDLLLVLSRHLVVAIHHVGIAPTALDQILNLLRRDTSPGVVSGASKLIEGWTYQWRYCQLTWSLIVT
jgi:hypothetical protein